MKQYTREELETLVNNISKEVSTFNTDISLTGNDNEDAINFLTETIVQVQKNCENIIIETLNHILND